MDIYDLFIMDEQSGDIIFYRGTRCLIRTKPINGKTNSIHGKYPDLKMVDNEVVVVYTEQYSTLYREKNIGKRIMLPIGEITEAKTWVWESDNLHKPTGLIAWSTVSISKEDFEYLKYKYQRFDDKKREIFLEILERLSGVSDKENIFETINVVDKIIHKEGASEPSKYLTRYEIKRSQMYAYRV